MVRSVTLNGQQVICEYRKADTGHTYRALDLGFDRSNFFENFPTNYTTNALCYFLLKFLSLYRMRSRFFIIPDYPQWDLRLFWYPDLFLISQISRIGIYKISCAHISGFKQNSHEHHHHVNHILSVCGCVCVFVYYAEWRGSDWDHVAQTEIDDKDAASIMRGWWWGWAGDGEAGDGKCPLASLLLELRGHWWRVIAAGSAGVSVVIRGICEKKHKKI